MKCYWAVYDSLKIGPNWSGILQVYNSEMYVPEVVILC